MRAHVIILCIYIETLLCLNSLYAQDQIKKCKSEAVPGLLLHKPKAVRHWASAPPKVQSKPKSSDPSGDALLQRNKKFIQIVRDIRLHEWDAWNTDLHAKRLVLTVIAHVSVAMLAVVPIYLLVAQSCNMEEQMGMTWLEKFFISCAVRYIVTDLAILVLKFAISFAAVRWFSGENIQMILKRVCCCSKRKEHQIHPSDSFSSTNNLDSRCVKTMLEDRMSLSGMDARVIDDFFTLL